MKLVIRNKWKVSSCALRGKMLLVRIIENKKNDAYLSQVWLSKG